MSIASRITSIEGHISDIYDSVELTGVDTTDIDKNLVNVPNTLKEGYIDIINNGTDTLYNNFPKVSGEGTSLTLNNTYQAPMRNNLKGNTSQTGTPTPTSPIPVNVVSGDNEINVVGKNLFDGTIYKENYVISSTGAESYNSNFNLYKMNLKPNTTYTIQFKSTDTVARSSRYIAYKSNDTFIEMIFDFTYDANESVTKTFTTPNETSYILFHIGKLVENIQVEKSSSASTYEPYQGNTYNIDLPVENLFDKSSTPISNASTTMSELETGVRATVTNAGNNRYSAYKLSNSDSLLGKTLNISATITTSGTNNAYIRFYWLNGNTLTSVIAQTINSTGNANFNIPSSYPSGSNGIAILFSSNASGASSVGDYVDYTNVMLTYDKYKGIYTPYGTTPIELCKIGNYQDYFAKSDGSNLFNYNLFETFTTTIQYVSINLKPNTKYTMSSNIPITSGVGTNLFFMKDGETASTSTNGVRPDTPVTLTTDSTGVVKVGYRTGTGVSANPKTDYWYMINEGSTASPYQPYGVGKWYLHKEIKKVVLNGSETISIYSSTSARVIFAIEGVMSNAESYTSDHTLPNMLSNRFIPIEQYKTFVIGNMARRTQTPNNLYLVYQPSTSLTDFETWLSTNNTSVYYALATPTNTEITDTTLINQLEELYIAKSKENQTNISQINNDLGFIISASALKKG